MKMYYITNEVTHEIKCNMKIPTYSLFYLVFPYEIRMAIVTYGSIVSILGLGTFIIHYKDTLEARKVKSRIEEAKKKEDIVKIHEADKKYRKMLQEQNPQPIKNIDMSEYY